MINTETIDSNIKVLAPEVIDQIAAGEVVERPAHLIKELVENSLDAQATEIAVDFSNGGRFVKVTDNGMGISPDDLPKAFLRFATSKIKSAEDIWRLSSFGFRGEALASISSVSKTTVFTSNRTNGEGYRITSTFGKLGSLEPVSRSRGCTVVVEELFQNVPARLKFMKSEVGESSHIKQTLKALAIANPQVEFRILQNGKLLYFWPAVSLKERVETILEIKPLLEGTAARGRIKARAFFSDPHQVSRVSKNIWFFAQNRPIQDRSLQAAVMEAYRNLLMTGEFPFVVCFLETDPSDIDVNIHPTKSQVKFVSPQDAFRVVQAAIRDVLVKAPWLNKETGEISSVGIGVSQKPQPVNLEFEDPELQRTQYKEKFESYWDLNFQSKDHFIAEKNQQWEQSPQNFFSSENQSKKWVGTELNSQAQKTRGLETELEVNTLRVGGRAEKVAEVETAIEGESKHEKNDFETRKDYILPTDVSTLFTPTAVLQNGDRNVIPSGNVTPNGDITPFTPSGDVTPTQAIPVTKPLIRHWSLLQVIGQAGLTYLVCQSEKGLVLIDQHAAHERVAFERLMNSWQGKKIDIQQFLFPLPLELSEEKMEVIRNRRGDFLKLGIEIEELGPTTMGIKAAPALIKNKILLEEIERFATQVLDWGDGDLLEKAIADICARMACHSVMRAGQSLSIPEMQRLLEEMDEFPLSSFCPHGRPVSVHYTWPELEKDFGRRT